MRNHLALTALLCLSVMTPAYAQTTTAVGTGISNSESNSGALAVAKGGSVNINNPANTTSDINQRVSGTQTVKTNPSMAVGLTAAGLETCLGSASGMISLAGFGLGGGSTMTDEGCQARLDSRTLFAMGLKSAAVARLCQRENIYASMPDICERYRPASAGPAPRVLLSTDTAGVLDIIDGKTGLTRPCDNYDPVKLKCRHWVGEPSVVIRRHKKIAAIAPTRSLEQAKAEKARKMSPSNAPAAKAIETALTPPKSVAPAAEKPAAPAAESTTKEN
jgi:hypothetical protein